MALWFIAVNTSTHLVSSQEVSIPRAEGNTWLYPALSVCSPPRWFEVILLNSVS